MEPTAKLIRSLHPRQSRPQTRPCPQKHPTEADGASKKPVARLPDRGSHRAPHWRL